MTIQELNSRLTNQLRVYIKAKGFVDSGKLLNSIQFNSTFIDNELNIKFDAMEYIKYLDNGNLLPKFLATNEPIQAIQEFYSTNLTII